MSTDTPRTDAPKNSLPDWFECELRVKNSKFIEKRVNEGGYGAEPDSKLASQVHHFIYEYDDADPYRSEWFLHRLELLLNETKKDATSQLERELAAEQEKVMEAEKENAQLRRLIDKGRESTATELGLAAQVDMYRNGAADLMEKCKMLREALDYCFNEMGRGMGIDDRFDAICYKARATLEATKP